MHCLCRSTHIIQTKKKNKKGTPLARTITAFVTPLPSSKYNFPSIYYIFCVLRQACIYWPYILKTQVINIGITESDGKNENNNRERGWRMKWTWLMYFMLTWLFFKDTGKLLSSLLPLRTLVIMLKAQSWGAKGSFYFYL